MLDDLRTGEFSLDALPKPFFLTTEFRCHVLILSQIPLQMPAITLSNARGRPYVSGSTRRRAGRQRCQERDGELHF